MYFSNITFSTARLPTISREPTRGSFSLVKSIPWVIL